jgi:hypothetical protein
LLSASLTLLATEIALAGIRAANCQLRKEAGEITRVRSYKLPGLAAGAGESLGV